MVTFRYKLFNIIEISKFNFIFIIISLELIIQFLLKY